MTDDYFAVVRKAIWGDGNAEAALDRIEADAEQLADALRSIVAVAAFHLAEYENSSSGAGSRKATPGSSRDASLAAPEASADPDAPYLHGIGMKC